VSTATIDRGAVRLCTLVDDEHGLTASYLRSLLPSLAVDLGGEQHLWRGGYMFQQCTSAGVVEGRNEAARQFLESDAEWLWFVDADMGWDPDALAQLLAVADPAERPIIGGLCFGYGPIRDGIGGQQAIPKVPFPTIFDLAETDDDAAFRPRWWYPANTLVKCSATGAAMLLIHRSVLEQIGAGWFDRIRHPKAKKLWGEDTSFCARAALAGFPTHVHTGVRTSHMKTIFVTEHVYQHEVTPQPATERVKVIVPVLGRPQNAEPFMRSLRASTGLATVIAVCSNDTDAEAWRHAGMGVSVLRIEATTFAAKVNAAMNAPRIWFDQQMAAGWFDEFDDPPTAPHVERLTAPWIFLVGDDVRFHPGWLDHAQQTAALTGAKVIGTNDLLTERVANGEHATHMLIARDYIDEVGASWDGPGTVAHAGYRHWYVDDEIVTAAKQRGVWAPSLGSIVEHLHHLNGKAEMDDTYRKGEFRAESDAKLFKERFEASMAVTA
jgi:Glycosyltransferase like family 2